MELKLEKANINTIPDAPRVVLAMLKEPFYFTRYKGVLYINEDLSGMDKITAAVKKAWESFAADPTDESMNASDDAYDLIAELHGETAAGQFNKYYLNAAKEYQDKLSTREAREWILTVYEDWTEERDEAMWQAGYRTRMANAMWQAMEELHREGHGYDSYRNHAYDAAATYGFLLGMEYGKKMGGNGHE